MQTKERTRYRVTYFKDQKHWDNGDYYYEDFDDLNNAMKFGKSNENGFGFQVERVEQIYRDHPSGYVYRNKEFGWEEKEGSERKLVYDGNIDFITES